MTSFRITEVTASWVANPDAVDQGQMFREGIIRTELNAIADGRLDITANIFVDFIEIDREAEAIQLEAAPIPITDAEPLANEFKLESLQVPATHIGPVAKLTAVARIILDDPLIRAEMLSGLPKEWTAEGAMCDLPWSTRRRLDILLNDDVLVALSALARAMGLPAIQGRTATTWRLSQEIAYVFDEVENRERYEAEREV